MQLSSIAKYLSQIAPGIAMITVFLVAVFSIAPCEAQTINFNWEKTEEMLPGVRLVAESIKGVRPI